MLLMRVPSTIGHSQRRAGLMRCKAPCDPSHRPHPHPSPQPPLAGSEKHRRYDWLGPATPCCLLFLLFLPEAPRSSEKAGRVLVQARITNALSNPAPSLAHRWPPKKGVMSVLLLPGPAGPAVGWQLQYAVRPTVPPSLCAASPFAVQTVSLVEEGGGEGGRWVTLRKWSNRVGTGRY